MNFTPSGLEFWVRKSRDRRSRTVGHRPGRLLATIRAVTEIPVQQPVGVTGARVADIDVNPAEALLEVKNLRTSFGSVHAVDNVSFNVRRGEAVALVGESGCGKSVTAMSIMRLIAPPGKITAGQVRFKGRDLAS